jgi:hypothetical protein
MKSYRLAIDGDSYEQKYWSLFIQNNFQGYEDFWIENIVPLTNRPTNIHFKTDQELAKIGKTANDICVAQLHYSILRHLARVFNIFRKGNVDLDDLTDGMTRLCGALDVAFELLERHQNPTAYDPWLAMKDNSGKMGSKEARENWERKLKSSNNFQENIKWIRYYRNHLVHGRMTPGISSGIYYFPKIGLEKEYFDWRKITNKEEMTKNKVAFIPASEILKLAWNDIIEYFDDQWRINLLKRDALEKSEKVEILENKTHSLIGATPSGQWADNETANNLGHFDIEDI